MANLSKEQNTHVAAVISAEQVSFVSQKQLDAASKNQGTSFVARLLAEKANQTLAVS